MVEKKISIKQTKFYYTRLDKINSGYNKQKEKTRREEKMEERRRCSSAEDNNSIPFIMNR
jgi:hypothetical protein